MELQDGTERERTGFEVAVVGMAGRFPGADDVHDFWRNLREGVESISFFTRDEVVASGTPEWLADHPGFVAAMGELRAADELDATLFGLAPRDAEILDPQHRLLLECAWSALEHAGYDPARETRPIGLFAGSGTSSYARNVESATEIAAAVGRRRIGLLNDKDHLAGGVAYRLNLRGPTLSVQTACSTSLVAVHLACQSLLTGECDVALAGAASVQVPLRHGYLYTPDGILSPDGRCRAYDAATQGTVGGNGVGVVVLKRLADAVADGDTVHAVVLGGAINNDGAQKVGYTAPSVDGQARVISEALSVAGVDAASLQYVEGHGSGTPLGDAIELKALGEVLARGGAGHRCAIGSVKTNVGHLDTAAGVTGLIKTVLSLENGEIPPSLHLATPHPEIESLGGRVFVNTELRPWERNGAPRRAGVSSFGIGGTNAHVVLEEAPPRDPSGPSRPHQLLLLSARTPSALESAAERLAAHLEREAPPLADAAFTLRVGRRELEHRRAVVCRDAAEAVAALRAGESRPAPAVPGGGRPVSFLFPGLGTHHVDMGRGVYEAEPVFRDAVDECCERLRPLLGSDLRRALFSAEPARDGNGGGGWDLRGLLSGATDGSGPLGRTRLAHPALFVVEYAMARLWMGWGVRPRALLGHSLGEYVAACVAGVLELEDALALVATRARLLDALPAGAMLAVPLGEEALRAVLPGDLDVAAVNTPGSCVVSGPVDAVDAFEARLAERGTVSRRLAARHAFHSRAMEPAAAELERLVEGFTLRAPETPVVSGVTGTWITDDEARSPAYWARHLCRTVRFADGVAALRRDAAGALLEVGPGQTLGAWALQHPAGGTPDGAAVFSALRHPRNRIDDHRFLLESLGGLWAAGVEVDWTSFADDERRHRIPLPGYPFERRRYWIDAAPEAATAPRGAGPGRTPDPSETAGAEAMESHSTTEKETSPRSSRHDAVLGRLREIAAELTGIAEEEIATDVDLFRTGFDSLLLLHGIQAIEKRLGVRLSLVEVLEDLTTLDALAGHIDAVLPPDEVVDHGSAPGAPEPPRSADAAEPPATVPAPPALFAAGTVPASANGGAAGGAVEQVVAQQLQAMTQLMAQQLAAVTGRAASEPASEPASATAPDAPPRGPGSAVPAPARPRFEPETFVAHRPTNTEAGGLTAEQKEYLDDFMARYVARTRASKAHQARYHAALADSRVTARFRRVWKEITYPIVSRRAHGSRVWDLDGNEYVDTGMAFGCALFGHAPDFVSRAIREQVECGYVVGPQSPDAGRAAELVCELGGTDRAVFCNSGTEAVMGAIRGARTYTGRDKIAYFAGSYHGWSDVVQGRVLPTGDGRVRPTAPGIPALPLEDVLILDYGRPESLERLADLLDQIAVVMVEPVQSRRPDLQPRAFLHELRRMTRETGTLLLFDELITGFRMGAGGAQSFYGVEADLVTYGKVVAGGLPMGVVAGTEEAMSVFDGGVWRYGDDSFPPAQRTLFAGAYFKHPLSMAVACAVLEEIRRRGAPMYRELDERTDRLMGRLNAFFEAGGYPVTAAHFSSCFRFYFGPEVRFADLFGQHLIHQGIHVIPETGTYFLSTAHDDDDVERIFEGVCAAAEAMRGGGLIPGPSGDRPAPADGGAGRAVAIRSARPAAGAAGRGDGVRALPLTEGQRQLWIESQMGGDAGLAYVESTSIRLHGALDVAALKRALQGLVDRHDTLRTTFAADGEAQHVHPSLQVELPVEEFHAVPADERRERIDAWVRGAVGRPFDLVRGPLVRFALGVVGAGEHLLLFDTHHAVLDGWSFSVLFRELGELYDAARAGRDAALPPRPDHARLVAARNDALRDADAAHAYWTERFADGVPVLDLPGDRPLPAVFGYRGGRVERVLDGDVAARLFAMARPHGLTVFNALLSAVFVWLGRLSGDDDVVVGTPAAGQAGTEPDEGLVGYAIQVLPVRARIDPAASFVEHARRVRRALLSGLEHRDFSFPRLVETLYPRRDPARPPVFSVMLNVDKARDEERLGDLRAEFRSEFGGGAKVDLSLDLTETPDALHLRCVYRAELFDAATVERWLDALERLLDSIGRNPEAPLAELEMLGPEERARVVEEWSGTESPALPHDCVHASIEAQAARSPGAVAVTFEERSLTYAELNARANRLAHHLAGLGVRPEVRVGICLERSPELVVAALAVLKAGGAYVPLDPAYPAERLAYMLADAGVAVLLTREGLRDALPAAPGAAVVCLDAARDAIARESAENPRSGVSASNLAYVIYTSGSTGRPKGVMNAHRGVVNRLRWMQGEYGIGADDVVLQKTPFSFDVSVWELFWPLREGARLAVALPDGHRDPAYIQEVIEREGVTTIHFVPSMLQHFVEGADPARCGTLRRVVCSGEALPPALVQRFHERFPAGTTLHNLYGPTEAAVDVSHWPCERGAPAGVVPIGRPVWNTRLYVLDPALSPAPPGVPGELHIGGVQVARGYLGRPALTAERFVPDPFSAEPGGRLYRTGDRVRWSADGVLEYLGRLDQQVKIRGFRIEPGEVEAVLRRHPGVRECAVVAREDDPGDPRLVGYVAGGAEPEALRDALRRSLPDHMVPVLVFLDALPLGPSGKLDRRALPAPTYRTPEERYAAPRTPAEEVMVAIWSEVLRRERVGAEDDFFEMGGQSLLATRVAARVRDAFGVELPVRTLFEAPTARALAGRVEALRRDAPPPAPPVKPVPRDGPLPLSFAQERLWFLERLHPGNASYNHPLALRMSGDLDREALERALGEIVRRHETLRTRLRDVDGTAVQEVAPPAPFALPVDDLSHLDAGAREAEARRRAREDAARPFDLSTDAPLRATLLRLEPAEHVLLLCLHHVATDGWSTGVLFRELEALYGAYRAGEASPLRELPVQYADFAVWQRERLRGEAMERGVAYWRERLADAPPLLELPTDRPRPARPSYRGAQVPVEIPAPLAHRLEALGRREGATPFMVLLAAFQLLLGRYASADDVVVGTPVAGRSRRELEELIGFFVDTLALRTDLSGDPTFRQVLHRARETTLGAHEHRDVPFERLVDELRPERSLRHAPVFQTMLVLLDGGDGAPGLPGLEVSPLRTEPETAKFDLTLLLEPHDGGFRGALEYATDLFDADTVRRLGEHLLRLLERVAGDTELPLSRIDLTGAEERARLLGEWSRGGEPVAEDAAVPVHGRFEAQADRTPDAPALIDGDERVTYRDLDRRANRLARFLAVRGVGPETRVGLCLERGADAVVAVLAVLKAGGAYVPVDPADPAERIGRLLGGAGAAVTLTHERLRERVAAALPAGEVVSVDAVRDEVGRESAARPDVAVDPANLAYVIHTSGSTGRPKGVGVEHRALSAYLAWASRAYPAGGSAVHTSLAFDLTVTSLFVPLLGGGTVELIEPGSAADGLAARLRRGDGCPTLKLTPAHLRLLEEQVEAEELRAGVDCLVVGGEALLGEHLALWRRALPAARIVNEYGPTETVVGCCVHEIRAADASPGPVPIGRPSPGTRLYVLDATGGPAPRGVPGELYVGGAQVARGYLGRAAATAERFVPDPFGERPGARMYRTGDRVRRRADGTLEYLGRADTQVKVRGYRVEPGEVEATIARHDAVREAAVVAGRDATGEMRLVAYVAGDADADALRAWLRERLPEHMVPAALVPVDALPLTSAGKVDRRALPPPEAAPRDGVDEPADYVEARLIPLWEELLGVRGIGPTQSFFDLGGNSMLALRLFTHVNRSLGCDLPVSTLFTGATVRDMAAAVLRQKRAALPPGPVVPLQPDGRLPTLFCVHSADRNVMGYVSLVRHLGPEQPVYGVRDLGDAGRPVARIAADHVRALREVQPHGPYSLVSWSFGGVVTFEMAVQLRSAGEEVAFLGLLDTLSPVLMDEWPWDDDADVAVVLAQEVAQRMRRPFRLVREEVEAWPPDERVRRIVEAMHAQGAAPPGFDAAALESACRTTYARNRSRDGYEPARFDGTLTLFRAEDVPARTRDFLDSYPEEERRSLGWCRHAARVEVHPVPGSHAMLASEPHVRVLAARMRESLVAARARTGGTVADAAAAVAP